MFYGNRRYDGIGTGGMYFLGEMTKRICLLIGIFQKHNRRYDSRRKIEAIFIHNL